MKKENLDPEIQKSIKLEAIIRSQTSKHVCFAQLIAQVTRNAEEPAGIPARLALKARLDKPEPHLALRNC